MVCIDTLARRRRGPFCAHFDALGLELKGGFPAHGASGADVARWVRRNAEVQQRPITVNGVSYPSPAIGGAIFQLGDSNSGAGGWAGYNVEYALPELRTFWSEGG